MHTKRICLRSVVILLCCVLSTHAASAHYSTHNSECATYIRFVNAEHTLNAKAFGNRPKTTRRRYTQYKASHCRRCRPACNTRTPLRRLPPTSRAPSSSSSYTAPNHIHTHRNMLLLHIKHSRARRQLVICFGPGNIHRRTAHTDTLGRVVFWCVRKKCANLCACTPNGQRVANFKLLKTKKKNCFDAFEFKNAANCNVFVKISLLLVNLIFYPYSFSEHFLVALFFGIFLPENVIALPRKNTPQNCRHPCQDFLDYIQCFSTSCVARKCEIKVHNFFFNQLKNSKNKKKNAIVA